MGDDIEEQGRRRRSGDHGKGNNVDRGRQGDRDNAGRKSQERVKQEEENRDVILSRKTHNEFLHPTAK